MVSGNLKLIVIDVFSWWFKGGVFGLYCFSIEGIKVVIVEFYKVIL